MTPSKSPNLAERIFNELQARILSDRIAADQRLASERHLATELDTNRNTLREAIRRLEQQRLVSVRHGQGVTVQDFRRTALADVFEPFLRFGRSVPERVAVFRDLLPIRTAVMTTVVTLAAERATAEDHDHLASRAATQLAAFRARDALAMARGDVAWLDALVEAAHSLTMRWFANSILDGYRSVSDRLPQLWLLEQSYPAHMRELVDAIAQGDGAAARASVEAFYKRNDVHVLAQIDRVVASIDGGDTAEETER